MTGKEILRRLCLLAGLAFFCAVFFTLFPIGCPLKRLTGVPCPSCGMTRAWFAALRLDFSQAFSLHPLFWAVPPVALLLTFGRGRFFYWACAAVGVLFLGVYLWRMLQYFPSVYPMEYDYGSLLARLMGWSAGG